MDEKITFHFLSGLTDVVFCTLRGAAVERVREDLFLINQGRDQNYFHLHKRTHV